MRLARTPNGPGFPPDQLAFFGLFSIGSCFQTYIHKDFQQRGGGRHCSLAQLCSMTAPEEQAAANGEQQPVENQEAQDGEQVGVYQQDILPPAAPFSHSDAGH